MPGKKRGYTMKTKISLAMACFIAFILCSFAVAYMPVLIVHECPHCKAHVVEEDTLFGNTIGAKIYTDGKREAKMLADHPALVKCPVCGGQLFWVDEAKEVDSGFAEAVGLAGAAVAAGIVAALIAVIVYFAVLGFFNWLKTVWQDDPFPSKTRSIKIQSWDAATFDYAADKLWGPNNFIGHSGHYFVEYTWRCCD